MEISWLEAETAAYEWIEDFRSCKTGTGMTFAILKRAEQRLFGTSTHFINFPLMSQKTARIGKALKLFAAADLAFI
jgi:hypothetical protein